MKLKKVLDCKFTYLFIGMFMTGIFTYFFNAKLIEKEYFYKVKSEKQNFVFELSQMLQKRIYNGKVFFWNVKNNARKNTILDSWENYKKITIGWNEQLPNYYFELDIYFPPSKHIVKNYSDYLKSELSFRVFLKNEIQLEIIPIHSQLVELKKLVIKDERPNQELLTEMEKNIGKLHAKIANYSEMLYKSINN